MCKKIAYTVCIITMILFGACSTKKNTPMTRRVQAFKARYNTYFNAHQAYLEGIEAQRTGNKDNYTEIIPLFMTANKSTVGLGKANFDKAIEKSKKTIKQHSITARPEMKNNRKRTPKEKIWLAQKEYNPFLYKAWFLLGEAQFHQGEYMEAAATFAYIQRQYFSKPNIIAKARILEAKCYAELKWYYDAENLLTTAQRDSIPTNLMPVRDAILADCQIGQKQYREAIPNLKNAIKKAQGSYQKARMYFLLGQLYHQVGENQEAYKAFKKVISKNPPYELAFNARIQMTEVMSEGQSKQMIRKLTSMSKNPKNKDYLDQVYYAIGNIYMANKDTLHAIWAYKDGVEKSTRNGVDKGVVWLHLGQLYWEKEQFSKAKECYAGALGLFDKEREDYKEVDYRTKILEELYPHASAVELQDSLQTLAKMDSVKRMEVIKKIIEDVKKKEKEEAKKAANANNVARTNPNANRNANAGAAGGRNQGGGVWYFYNPTAVAAGKSEFQKKWGQRELSDDWRRSNRTVLANDDNDSNSDNPDGDDGEVNSEGEGGQPAEGDRQQTDGQGSDGAKVELSEAEQEAMKKQQEYESDPHRPEYYLKDIPLTEEQMEASNKALVEGLYNSGIIYKDRMENFPLAERTFKRVLNDFPEYEHIDETYYNLFQLYARQGMSYEADMYKDKLIAEFPDNEHGKLISDPQFEFKGKYGKAIEDSIYQQAYEHYKNDEYAEVVSLSQYTMENYPNEANRARFMFLEAMSQLELGNRNEFMTLMKDIVDKYPKSTVSELAGLYVKGVKDGRILASGKMEMGSVWDRRAGFLIDGDSALTDTAFTDKQDEIHVFVIAYEHNSLNENQLLYEIAKYNFMNFPVRNFDINIEIGEGVDMLQVRPFLGYDEAFVYQKKLENDEEMAYKLEGLKWFVISDHNLKLVNKGMSFNDYFNFLEETYTEENEPEFDENLLNEPAELKGDQPTEGDKQEEEKKDDVEKEDNGEFGDFNDFDDEPETKQEVEQQGQFLDDIDDEPETKQEVEQQGQFLDDIDDEPETKQEVEQQGQFLDDIDDEPETKQEVEQQGQFLDDIDDEPETKQEVEQQGQFLDNIDDEPETKVEEQQQNTDNNGKKEEEKQEEWDGNVEDFDDDIQEGNQQQELEEWDGNVEDFDDENGNVNTIIGTGNNDWDDEDDEDYIF